MIYNIISFFTGLIIGYLSVNYFKEYYAMKKLKNNYSDKLNKKYNDL